MLTRQTYPILVGASTALVFFAGWLAVGWGGPTTIATVRNIGSVVFSVFAVACATAAATVSRTERRRVWITLAVGLSGWVVGGLIWLYYQLVRHASPPFPSLADFAFLLLPLSFFIAWMVGPPIRRRLGVRASLDTAVVASALFLISWVAVLSEVFEVATASRLQLSIQAVYVVADLAVVTISLMILSSAPPEQRQILGAVTAGFMVVAFADCTAVYLRAHDMEASNLAVVSWVVGLVLLSSAALMAVGESGPDDASTPRRHTRMILWLPYVPMPVAVVFGFVASWPVAELRPITIAAAVMVIAALARQFLVTAQNRSLLDAAAEQALRDPLTGLANRAQLTNELSYAMQSREQDDREIAVLSLDLDDFKLVIDDMGRPSGDTLLRSVADRLRNSVRPGDTVARLGGDQFAVLIQDSPQPSTEVASRVSEAFDKPFFLGDEEVYIHPSVGLAGVTPDETVDADDLIKRADLAMYTAKRAGTGGVQLYTPDLRHLESAEVKSRRSSVIGVQLLGRLRRAIDDSELTLVYQPKVGLDTGAIVGVEALVRWPHPDLGVLTPNQFLPLVRRKGLMGAVTDLVLDKAVRDAASWFDANDCTVPVAINLFATSLNDATLPQRIAIALNRSALPPTALAVEITEHLLVADTVRASAVISRLQQTGLRIAIDDFGSGYATMSYLRDLPVDELKLDRQFIVPILQSVRAAAIVRSVIDLAHALNIACVAEGVEDEATANRLREYGCDVAQGHYYSPPVPADELRRYLALEECSKSATLPIASRRPEN